MKFEFFEALWGVKKEFRLKVSFLTLAFFLMTGCQAMWRPIKNTVFMSIVGVKNIPDAKLGFLIPVIILILIYSKLADVVRRHHLFYFMTLFHAIGGLVIYYFLQDPAYGLENTATSSGRIFGWVVYFFMESFGAFMSTTFWGFANSINNPKDAKNYYGIFVAGSKVGGILFALLLYLLASFSPISGHLLISDCVLLGSLLLIGAAGAIFLLMRFVPGYYMHGYEAAYQAEKRRAATEEKKPFSFTNSIWETVDGLKLIISNSYVFGIFALILSYDTIAVIFDYLVMLAADAEPHTVKSLAAYLSHYQLLMHSIGLGIALFGTAPIQRFLGVRLSLLACPLLCMSVIVIALFNPTAGVLYYSLVVMRALNYGLNHPTREALFIPTSKAIKFKAKAWTDAFGSRFAKGTGSVLNKVIQSGFIRTSISCTFAISIVWLTVSYFLGRTCQRVVENNTVIGIDSTVSAESVDDDIQTT